MKMKWAVSLLIGFSVASAGEAQGFVNLHFEQAGIYLAPVPQGQAGGSVPITSGLPGWSGSFGGNPATQVLHNDLTLGAASIDILGPQFAASYIISGNYSVMLQAGISGSAVDTSITQTGAIPSGINSIQFKASESPGSGAFLVSFGGNTLSPILLSSGPNYNLYGADVSQFAGETGPLTFTQVFSSSFPSLLLDDITFSTTSVPEPNSLFLVGFGGAVFALNRRVRPTIQ
ncbi:MAG TPA: PEP-CTERM sorting domain-containing protein [Verrucomicrobiae bacterium]|jgi:hypothetical protein|nr:PEP-CTERM sorting domain-containing protein [Verrucomicrobiae bacterium]